MSPRSLRFYIASSREAVLTIQPNASPLERGRSADSTPQNSFGSLRVSLLSTIFEVELDRDAHEAVSLKIQTAAPRMQCRHSTMRIQKTS
jgi:hypothetical protein